MTTASKTMGFDSPSDQRVPIRVGDWNAMKLALWRSKVAFDIASRQAVEILGQCAHEDGCPGKDDDNAQCIAHRYDTEDAEEGKPHHVQIGCRDREMRASALVILNAARRFAPVDARALANQPYHSPSREFFSEVISDLAAAQAEIAMLHELLRQKGIEVPEPPPNAPGALAQKQAAPQLPAVQQEVE